MGLILHFYKQANAPSVTLSPFQGSVCQINAMKPSRRAGGDDPHPEKLKVVKRTIPTSFLDVNLIEIAEVFVAEENVDSTEGSKWFEPMWDYLAKGVLPQDKNEARNIIRQAHRYAILANRLYRRSFFGGY